MRIVKQNYSRGAWRLLMDDGKQVVSTIHDDYGDVIATGQPVCGDTKREVQDWVLCRLEWYVHIANMGVVAPLLK